MKETKKTKKTKKPNVVMPLFLIGTALICGMALLAFPIFHAYGKNTLTLCIVLGWIILGFLFQVSAFYIA